MNLKELTKTTKDKRKTFPIPLLFKCKQTYKIFSNKNAKEGPNRYNFF